MRKRKHYWELTDERKERAKARVRKWRDVNRDELTVLSVWLGVSPVDEFWKEREEEN